MAVKTFSGRSLIMTLNTGVDDDGNSIYKRKTINKFKESSIVDDIYQAGVLLASLQQYPVEYYAIDEDYLIN